MKAVLTTINKPTESIKRLVNSLNCDIIVVGDKKTPEYKFNSVTFVSYDKQGGFKISNILPFNSYTRKNIGYLMAMRDNNLIYETDDDNYVTQVVLPKIEGPSFVAHGEKFINYYTWFTGEGIWPRGLPLHFVHAGYRVGSLKSSLYPVQQRLVNKNPDVDAFYRLTIGGEFEFNEEANLSISTGSYAPFNSQNTWWFREAFPLMYLPSTCTFRMTDIWRGYIAQRCMREHHYRLLIGSADAVQDRNEHDLVDDLKQESDGYLRGVEFCDTLDSLILTRDMCRDLVICYTKLIDKGFFKEDELNILKAWINDIQSN